MTTSSDISQPLSVELQPTTSQEPETLAFKVLNIECSDVARLSPVDRMFKLIAKRLHGNMCERYSITPTQLPATEDQPKESDSTQTGVDLSVFAPPPAASDAGKEQTSQTKSDWTQPSPEQLEDWNNSPLRFWIAGGAIASAITDAPINDYDIFTNDVAAMYDLMSAVYDKTFENEFVTNFKTATGTKLQLVKRFSPTTPADIFRTFDFTIVSGAVGFDGFTYHSRLFIDIAQKRLVVENVHFPLSTIERIAKYSRRGYVACPKGILKVCKTLHETPIDWDNPSQNMLEFYPDGTPRFQGVD